MRKNLNKHVQYNLVSSYIYSHDKLTMRYELCEWGYHNLSCKEFVMQLVWITRRVLHWWDHHHCYIENSDVGCGNVYTLLVVHLKLAYTEIPLEVVVHFLTMFPAVPITFFVSLLGLKLLDTIVRTHFLLYLPILNHRTIDRRKRLIIAMDAAFGMEYLHGKNIVHFDLKSHNFLVNMRDPHRPVCKVIYLIRTFAGFY